MTNDNLDKFDISQDPIKKAKTYYEYSKKVTGGEMKQDEQGFRAPRTLSDMNRVNSNGVLEERPPMRLEERPPMRPVSADMRPAYADNGIIKEPPRGNRGSALTGRIGDDKWSRIKDYITNDATPTTNSSDIDVTKYLPKKGLLDNSANYKRQQAMSSLLQGQYDDTRTKLEKQLYTMEKNPISEKDIPEEYKIRPEVSKQNDYEKWLRPKQNDYERLTPKQNEKHNMFMRKEDIQPAVHAVVGGAVAQELGMNSFKYAKDQPAAPSYKYKDTAIILPNNVDIYDDEAVVRETAQLNSLIDMTDDLYPY